MFVSFQLKSVWDQGWCKHSDELNRTVMIYVMTETSLLENGPQIHQPERFFIWTLLTKSWTVDETWFFIKKPLLSAEIFVSWCWKMKFLKNKTYLFPYIASGTHGDYISFVFFVSVGCALQGKTQLSKGPWHDIVMVHPLMEVAAQRACLTSVLCPCFAHVVQSTEHHDSVSETTILCFFWFWF